MAGGSILRNPMKSYEIPRNSMKSYEILWNPKKSYEIPKNPMQKQKNMQNPIQKQKNGQRFPRKFCEILRNPTKSRVWAVFWSVWGVFCYCCALFFWCLKGAPMENFSDSCWCFWDQLLVIFGAPLWDLIWYPDLGPYKTFCYVAWNFARAIFRLFCSPFWTFFLAGGLESSFGV